MGDLLNDIKPSVVAAKNGLPEQWTSEETVRAVAEAVRQLPPAQSRQVLIFAQELLKRVTANDEALGRLGAEMAAQVWPKEDFSDWWAKTNGARSGKPDEAG